MDLIDHKNAVQRRLPSIHATSARRPKAVMMLNLLTQHYATLRESSVRNGFRSKVREFVVDTPISRHWQAGRR
jgi:hypothetical protein